MKHMSGFFAMLTLFISIWFVFFYWEFSLFLRVWRQWWRTRVIVSGSKKLELNVGDGGGMEKILLNRQRRSGLQGPRLEFTGHRRSSTIVLCNKDFNAQKSEQWCFQVSDEVCLEGASWYQNWISGWEFIFHPFSIPNGKSFDHEFRTMELWEIIDCISLPKQKWFKVLCFLDSDP